MKESSFQSNNDTTLSFKGLNLRYLGKFYASKYNSDFRYIIDEKQRSRIIRMPMIMIKCKTCEVFPALYVLDWY